MKFGVREVANVVFKAKDNMKIGKTQFKKGQPVLYIDSAKTTSMEGAATTVYADGGRGNTHLLAWEGDKTLTVTVEDALLSPIGFSILSGAGLFSTRSNSDISKLHVHKLVKAIAKQVADDDTDVPTGYTHFIDLTNAIPTGYDLDYTVDESDLKVVDKDNTTILLLEEDDSIEKSLELDGTTNKIIAVSKEDNASTATVDERVKKIYFKPATASDIAGTGTPVFVDFYIVKTVSGGVAPTGYSEWQIDAEHFGGYFYVEADTLFRKYKTGKDMPAILTYPKVKIQSNFTFSMASSGDPSTFTFTMDAMPDYTNFDSQKKVLCVLQVLDEDVSVSSGDNYVM